MHRHSNWKALHSLENNVHLFSVCTRHSQESTRHALNIRSGFYSGLVQAFMQEVTWPEVFQGGPNSDICLGEWCDTWLAKVVPMRADLWKEFIISGWLRMMEKEAPEQTPRFVASLKGELEMVNQGWVEGETGWAVTHETPGLGLQRVHSWKHGPHHRYKQEPLTIWPK